MLAASLLMGAGLVAAMAALPDFTTLDTLSRVGALVALVVGGAALFFLMGRLTGALVPAEIIALFRGKRDTGDTGSQALPD